MQFLVGVIIDIHLGTSLELVYLPFHTFKLVLRSLVVKSGIDLVILIGVYPRVLI